MALTDGPVRARLLELWLPMIGGVLAVKAIGVSDAYFVGQLGETPLAAISFTFPVVMTLISLAIGLSAGASSVLSRAIGDGADEADQRAIVTGAIAMGVVVSLALALVGYFSVSHVLALMGATGDILSSATRYMQIWFVGSIFLIVPIAINGLLRSTGDGVSPALLMVAVAALNIGLNPVFIFGLGPAPELGMQGAAVATVLARGASMIGALALIWHRDLLRASADALRAGLRHWREVARVGLPASLSTSLNPIAISIATAAVATLGSAEVAAFGVVTKIQSFAVVPLLALSATTPPFVGQNSGAGMTDRSRRALFMCAVAALAWSIVSAAVLFALADRIVSLFNDTPGVVEAGSLYLMIVPLSFVGYGITVFLSAAMNGLGRSITALMIGGGRALVLLAPAAWIGVLAGGFAGLAIGVAITNLIAGTVGMIIIARHSLRTRDGTDASCPEAAECD